MIFLIKCNGVLFFKNYWRIIMSVIFLKISFIVINLNFYFRKFVNYFIIILRIVKSFDVKFENI